MYCLGNLGLSWGGGRKKINHRKQEIISAEEGLGGPRRGRRFAGADGGANWGDCPPPPPPAPLRNLINNKLLRRRPCPRGDTRSHSRENCAGAGGGGVPLPGCPVPRQAEQPTSRIWKPRGGFGGERDVLPSRSRGKIPKKSSRPWKSSFGCPHSVRGNGDGREGQGGG